MAKSKDAIKYALREVKTADAVGFADVILACIALTDELCKFKVIVGHPRIELPKMAKGDNIPMIQTAGRYGGVNVGRYNTADETYAASCWFNGVHTGNIGVVQYNEKTSGKGLEGGSANWCKAFGEHTGLELVKVNQKAKASTGGTQIADEW